MMSLMARLCALCALSAVIQMTLSGARDLLASLSEAASVEAILKCLMQ